MVICVEQGADLHMAQLMPLPLTVSCSSKIQIGFTFLVPAHPGSPGQRAVKRVCVCVCVRCCAMQLPTDSFSSDPERSWLQPVTSLAISPAEEMLVCCTSHSQIYAYSLSGTDTAAPTATHAQVSPVVYWGGGIRGYTPYTNLRVFLTAYTHLSDHK